MTRYDEETESKMRLHFSQLNEKNKRNYVAMESMKLGYGGQKYICELFNVTDYLVRAGTREILNPSLLDDIPEGKIRRIGGGRKKKRLATPK